MSGGKVEIESNAPSKIGSVLTTTSMQLITYICSSGAEAIVTVNSMAAFCYYQLLLPLVCVHVLPEFSSAALVHQEL